MTQETKTPKRLAEIVADMRNRAANAEAHGEERLTSGFAFGQLLRYFADEIECAAAPHQCQYPNDGCNYRLMDGACVHPCVHGKRNDNAAAMREALEAVVECAKDGVLTIRQGAFDKVVAALAAPARNCDVGTAKEQKWRFLAVCEDKKHYDNVRECPLFVGPNCYPVDCFARWAQLPYEVAQDGGEE